MRSSQRAISVRLLPPAHTNRCLLHIHITATRPYTFTPSATRPYTFTAPPPDAWSTSLLTMLPYELTAPGAALKSGVVLCELLNAIRPKTVRFPRAL